MLLDNLDQYLHIFNHNCVHEYIISVKSMQKYAEVCRGAIFENYSSYGKKMFVHKRIKLYHISRSVFLSVDYNAVEVKVAISFRFSTSRLLNCIKV